MTSKTFNNLSSLLPQSSYRVYIWNSVCFVYIHFRVVHACMIQYHANYLFAISEKSQSNLERISARLNAPHTSSHVESSQKEAATQHNHTPIIIIRILTNNWNSHKNEKIMRLFVMDLFVFFSIKFQMCERFIAFPKKTRQDNVNALTVYVTPGKLPWML